MLHLETSLRLPEIYFAHLVLGHELSDILNFVKT